MTSNSGKYAYIDQLRGIAVLMVVLVHTSQKVPGLSLFSETLAKYGQMGVQLFFVASAYTLCLSSHRRVDEAAPIRSFYIRRYFRIAPLYYVGIVVYSIVHWIASVGERNWPGPYSIDNVVANAMFLHGVVPSANNSVVPGGWSIGAEMLFYLVFPVLFSMFARLYDKYGAQALLMPVLVGLSVNLIVQFVLASTPMQIKNNNFMYFFIINQIPVFMLGIYSYFLYERRGFIVDGRILFVGFLMATSFVLAVWALKKPLSFMVMPTLAGVSFCFLLGILKGGPLRFVVLERIGKISYSIYIFHFLFAWYLVPYLADVVRLPVDPDLLLLLSFMVVVYSTFVVASWTEKMIEGRGIDVGNRVVQRLQARLALQVRAGLVK